ncbi:MAG: TIGR03016 family PEP-CTERM system-associated outer membrane protein [Gammaproteobacteria bacterium]|nr:TIGR03016 family PEP-CTERM system-associated outer membrane protein [Gammaproteobacteria bacterium]
MNLKNVSISLKWTLLVTVFVIGGTFKPSNAADWNLQPSLYFSVSHNDNVFLSAAGQEKQDFITQINPRVNLSREGGSSNLELDYMMQNVIYLDESQYNDTFHMLNARGGSEIVPDLLYVDASAGRTQVLTSRDVAVPADNVTISSARTDLDLFSVSPYARYQFGRQAVGELRFTQAWYEYSNPSNVDSVEQKESVDIHSQNPHQKIGWAITYNSQKIIPDNNLESRLEEELVDLNVRITPRIQLLLTGGYEKNEYEYLSGLFVEKGSIWKAGFRLAPGHGVTVVARYGERFFGKTKSFNINKNGRVWNIGVSYNEELRTSAGTLLSNQAQSNVVDSITGIADPLPRTEVFLNEDFTVNLARRYGKTDLVLSYYERKRVFRVTGNIEDISGGTGDIFWMFIPRTKLNIGYSINHEDLILDNSRDELTQRRLGVERQVRENISFAMYYRYYSRNTDSSSRYNFQQNQYTASLSIIF